MTRNHFKDPTLKKNTHPEEVLSAQISNPYKAHTLNNRECCLDIGFLDDKWVIFGNIIIVIMQDTFYSVGPKFFGTTAKSNNPSI